jgi:hypothetical protein
MEQKAVLGEKKRVCELYSRSSFGAKKRLNTKK